MDDELDALFLRVEGPPDGEPGPHDAASAPDLTIGDMARAFGLTPRALRFYEDRGLLSPRREGAARLYGRAERQRLTLVLRAKRLGFTLDEIRRMLNAPAEPADAGALSISRRQCFDQIKYLEQRKREIDAALTELRRTHSSFYVRLIESAERNSA